MLEQQWAVGAGNAKINEKEKEKEKEEKEEKVALCCSLWQMVDGLITGCRCQSWWDSLQPLEDRLDHSSLATEYTLTKSSQTWTQPHLSLQTANILSAIKRRESQISRFWAKNVHNGAPVQWGDNHTAFMTDEDQVPRGDTAEATDQTHSSAHYKAQTLAFSYLWISLHEGCYCWLLRVVIY